MLRLREEMFTIGINEIHIQYKHEYMGNRVILPLNFIKLVLFRFEIVFFTTLFTGHEGP
jgi:hypothetical protein